MSEGTEERGTSRARFLGGAAVLAGMAAGAGALAREGKSADGRSYVAGNFMLDLDGVSGGFLKSVDGGAITADVIEEGGDDYYAKKHIGQPKYEEFEIEIGASMSKAVYDWISTSWQGNHTRKDGSIIAADFQLNAVAQRDFFEALLTEVTIPSADAGSKEPAYMTLKFAPELTRKGKPSGGKVGSPGGKGGQKQWLPSNFRLTIDKLDCTKVNKIDSFTIKQTVATDDVGSGRDYEQEPGKLEFPNLSITMAETGIAEWEAWHEDFVVKGNNSQESEKNGSLVFLSPNRADELLEIKFFNLGIFKLAPDKAEANADQIRRWTAELYCERMEFVYKAGAAA